MHKNIYNKKDIISLQIVLICWMSQSRVPAVTGAAYLPQVIGPFIIAA